MNEIRPTSGPILPPVGPAAAAGANAGAAGTNAADTARDFEAVFLGQMARIMLESVEIGDQFSGGHGEEMFRGILAENLGTEMARRGGVGLAPTVMDHIIRLQGGNPDAQ